VPSPKFDNAGETNMILDVEDELELYKFTPLGAELSALVLVSTVAKLEAPLSMSPDQQAGKFGIETASKFSEKSETDAQAVVNSNGPTQLLNPFVKQLALTKTS